MWAEEAKKVYIEQTEKLEYKKEYKFWGREKGKIILQPERYIESNVNGKKKTELEEEISRMKKKRRHASLSIKYKRKTGNRG